MQYTVTNVIGSSSKAVLPYGYSSWIDYWEKKTGRIATYCHCIGCLQKATDGAHVYVAGYGYNWYIVPLCHAHNLTRDSFVVEGPLVPINPNLPILW